MSERDIFFQALDRDDPAERAAFLDGACGGDAALRRRIEALLSSHAKAQGFLDTPAAQQLAARGDKPAERPAAGVPLDFLAPSPRADSLGRLGHYEVLEVVGQGGMGVVLRAFDAKLHRVVAIKALLPALASSGSARQRFVREAQAAAAVSHDHVIGIHAVEDAGPVPYLVMQFVDGLTLQEKLDRTGPLPLREVLRIGLQVAAGLAAAHAQGLVHRDVKPANILLENGVERVKLTDFGLARAADDASLTQSGVIAGTPAYMSPEQANGEHVDHRSDLFSLGSVLYALCAGHAPFRAGGTMAVLKRVCEDTPRPLREVNADIPDWLEAVIARLHAKDPAGRFRTAAEVTDVLGRRLAGLQQSGTGEAVPDQSVPRPRGKPGLRYALAVLLLGAALLGAGTAAYRNFRRPADGAGAPDGARAADGPGEAAAPQDPPWRPRPPRTPEELAKLPNLLDALQPEGMDLPPFSPPELLASLGEPPYFRVSALVSRGWMAQSGDGRLLAVPDGTGVLLFEAASGKFVKMLGGPPAGVSRLAFSPDGKWLGGTCGQDLFVWDLTGGRGDESAGPQAFGAVAFDRDRNYVVSADAGGTIWVGVKAIRVAHIAGHAGGITQVAFSPDYKRLATASLDGTCKVWDCTPRNPDDWKVLRTLRSSVTGFEALVWSRNGKLLAAGDDSAVTVWDADTYDEVRTLKAPCKGLLAFGPDGRTLFTARHDYQRGESHEFTSWDVTTGKQGKTHTLFTGGRAAFFHLSQDGRTVYVSENLSPADRLQAVDAETGLPRFPPAGHAGPVLSVAFSPDGRTLASGGADRTVRLWDLAGWKSGLSQPPSRVLTRHTDAVGSLTFSPDGRQLATAGAADGSLLVWDVASGREVHDLSVPAHRRSLVAFSPDGTTLAAGGEGRVHLWDVRTGKRGEPLCWNDGPVRAVAFSADGRLLAATDPRTVQVIDWKNDRCLRTLRTELPLRNLTFSPDGKTLAAITEEVPTLRLWDVDSGREQALRPARNKEFPIYDLAFHPGGRLAATASYFGWVHLWDVASPEKGPRTLVVQGGNAYCVAFSPEGRYAAVGLENGTIALLRLAKPGEVLAVPGDPQK